MPCVSQTVRCDPKEIIEQSIPLEFSSLLYGCGSTDSPEVGPQELTFWLQNGNPSLTATILRAKGRISKNHMSAKEREKNAGIVLLDLNATQTSRIN